MNNVRTNSNPLGRFLWRLITIEFWLVVRLFKGGESFSRFLYHYLYRRRKIDRILQSDVIHIPSANLYAIPLDVLKTEREISSANNQLTKLIEWKVKTIQPKITETEIQLHDITIDLKKQAYLIKSNQTDYDYTNTRRLAPLVKTLLIEINPKIDRLQGKRDELTRLRNLAASSELFNSQAQVYDRAIMQVQIIIDKAEAFRQESLKFIRETLIERELVQSDLDPDLVDWPLDFENQYQLIQEKYHLWKAEVKAYLELKELSD